MRTQIIITCIMWICACFTGGVSCLWGEVIKNPLPTHVEKEFVKMELVMEIDEEIDNSRFLAKPMSLAVNSHMEIYVYDALLKTIFHFDKKGKLLRTFGRQGQGPSEFSGSDSGSKKLYCADDGFLYVAAPLNKKIIVFDRDGTHIKDIRLPITVVRKGFFPVVDKSKNIYTISNHDGAIDIYNPKMTRTATLLTIADYKCFLFHEPKFRRLKFNPAILPDISNTYYDVLPGISGGLFIYLSNSSTIYLFKKSKSAAQFNVWPKLALEQLRDRENKLRERSDSGEYIHSMALNVFVDKDNQPYIYLQSNNVKHLYRFNYDSNRISVFQTNKTNWCLFEVKKHGLFYGIRPGMSKRTKIRVLKEIKK